MNLARLLAVLGAWMLAFACGVEYEDAVIPEPAERDPWDGAWGILSVGGVSPALAGAEWFHTDSDAGSFTNSVAFHAERQRYVIRLVWEYAKVDGYSMPEGTTIVYTQEGSYTRGEDDYTFTPDNSGIVLVDSITLTADNAEDAPYIVSPVYDLFGFLIGHFVGVHFFETEGMRWAAIGPESGTWELDGSALQLTSSDGLERQYISRR